MDKVGRKILQINSVVNFGSTGRIAEDIGQKAMGEGWESYIAFGRNDKPSTSNKLKIGNDWDIKWHGVETRLFDRHGFASRNATYKLIKSIDKINPSIIHLHNLHGYYLNIEVLFDYLSKINIPVIWTLHDCWPMTGHCSHFSFIGCDKWETQCKKCPQKKAYPSSIWIDNSYTNFSTKKKLFTSIDNMQIVTVSHWMAEIVKKSFLNEYPTKTIYNGIDLITFNLKNTEGIKLKYNLDNKFIVLGVTNIWNKTKGLQDFIKLASFLKNDEVIILVGLSRNQIGLLPDNIIGIERTENINQLVALYSSSDVFINPTWEDNFPTTNLEALACGTPVITYNTGGSPEALTSETGYVIEQGNINGIRIAMDFIKEKGKDAYVKPCRQRALKNFNKEDRYAEYVQLYEKLLDK